LSITQKEAAIADAKKTAMTEARKKGIPENEIDTIDTLVNEVVKEEIALSWKKVCG